MAKETIYWATEHMGESEAARAVEEAAALLRQGGVVAFPTETVYGLGADATSTEAVERIYTAKGRPSDNPLIVHVAQIADVEALATEIGELERRLMARFWPGPLTVVLPVRTGAVSPRVTAGLDTVAVRMPDHPLALRLIAATGRPLAAPSANRSGRPSPTTAQHVLEDLDGRIAGVLGAGPAGIGLESTVIRVDKISGRIHVLRPGGVIAAELRAAAPEADVVVSGEAATTEETIPRSPGMKYAHYAPKGRLTVVRAAAASQAADGGDTAEPATERVARYIRQELQRLAALGETTGVLAFSNHADDYRADIVVACGTPGQPAEAARLLYAALRRFDDVGATAILAEAVPEDGLGQAIMNRLRKAADNRIINV